MAVSGRVATLLLILLLSPALALSSCVCEEPSACTAETKACMPTSCDPRCGKLFGLLSCENSCKECLGKSPRACGKVFGDCRTRCGEVGRTCNNECKRNVLNCPADCHEAMFDCITKCTNTV